jgi:hypothetical protein
VTDESLGHRQVGLFPGETAAVVVAVETQGDSGESEGIGEGFREVPDAAEATVVVVAVFRRPARPR